MGIACTDSQRLSPDMADDSARIRRCEAADEKLVRFAIGKAALEPLAVANRLGTSWPCISSF